MAYIFVTQPEGREDTFFDPDIIFPDEGENAVILQPDGIIPNYIQLGGLVAGPTVDNASIWIPKTVEILKTTSEEFEVADFLQSTDLLDKEAVAVVCHKLVDVLH